MILLGKWLRRIRRTVLEKRDAFLIVAILLALFFSLHGINWGRFEDWHPDQMVFRNLPLQDYSLVPRTFLKPPFHSYFSLIARIPAKGIAYLAQMPLPAAKAIELLFTRFLTILLFVGILITMFSIASLAFGKKSAGPLSLLVGTSAGFIAFSHFLTVDIPVTFWMLLSLYFAVRIVLAPARWSYVLAGFFAGIASATKYNGLAIGISLVAAHVLTFSRFEWKSPSFWRRLLLDRNFLFGLVMVPVGFLLGNPYALLDYSRFVNDFMYNLAVTPVYGGDTSGTGYVAFFESIVELVGLPAFLLFFTGSLFSLVRLFRPSTSSEERKVLTILWINVLIYFLYFGSFPRLETRFVLPIVPIWLLLSGPLLYQMTRYKTVFAIVLAVILIYNVISSYYVGKRFLEDPRMDAQVWVRENVPRGSVIESTRYVPGWNLVPGMEVVDVRMPHITGRRGLFEDLLAGNEWVENTIADIEVETEGQLAWFSEDALVEREPDFVAINSIYYSRFIGNPYYPSIEEFFSKLLNEDTAYRIRYQRHTEEVPLWLYPQHIDALANIMTILEKGD